MNLFVSFVFFVDNDVLVNTLTASIDVNHVNY